MSTTPKVLTIEIVRFGEAPWFALNSVDPEVSAEVIALVTYHVAAVRAACSDQPHWREGEWLHGVTMGYLHAAISCGDIFWDGERWRLREVSPWAWLQKVWKRLWG